MTNPLSPIRLQEAVTCSVAGCAKRVQARGLCPMHYQRQRKHGDTATIAKNGPPRIADEVADAPRTCRHCGIVFAANPAAPRAQRRRQAFCSTTCRNHARRRPREGWFDGQFEPELNTGCWLWLGKVDSHGYGRASYQGVVYAAHRLSYSLHRKHPGDLHVCHRCDTPACVNPTHLFLGTRSDNMRDMMTKGRGRPGGRTL